MPRVLCLHGFTGAGSAWDDLCAHLPDDWEVLAPDLLGHDPDDAIDGSTFEDEVARLAGELDRRSWREVHLAGYSMGARVGLGLLVGHRELFSSATLIGVHPGLPTEAERWARRTFDETLAKQIESKGIEPFVHYWERRPLFASQRRLAPEILERQRRRRLSRRPAGLARSLRVLGLGSMPDYRPRLAELELPVRLVVGEDDEKFSRLAEELADALPHATVEMVPSVGHNPVLEAPAAVARALRATIR